MGTLGVIGAIGGAILVNKANHKVNEIVANFNHELEGVQQEAPENFEEIVQEKTLEVTIDVFKRLIPSYSVMLTGWGLLIYSMVSLVRNKEGGVIYE